MNKTQGRKNTYFFPDKNSNIPSYILKFSSIGKQESRESYYYMPHTQEEYELIYIISGEKRYRCNGKDHHIKKGEMYFIQPGQLHEEISSTGYLSFYYLKFFCYDLKGNFAYLTEDTDKQIIKKPGRGTGNIIRNIYDEISHKRPGYYQMAEACLNQVVIRVRRLLENTPVNHGTAADAEGNSEYVLDRWTHSLVEEVTNYIQTNIGKFFSMDDLAKHVSVSKSYLHALFKKVYKIPPIKFMVENKILYSKHLLVTTNMTVSAIAYYLGFCSPAHFSAAFKDDTGISPKLYRQKHSR